MPRLTMIYHLPSTPLLICSHTHPSMRSGCITHHPARSCPSTPPTNTTIISSHLIIIIIPLIIYPMMYGPPDIFILIHPLFLFLVHSFIHSFIGWAGGWGGALGTPLSFVYKPIYIYNNTRKQTTVRCIIILTWLEYDTIQSVGGVINEIRFVLRT
ncbi:hypothetical protein K438DRAFT_556794 [Mycena galopus ATCC 62051]|nr:hypothetical protein K438DRAFT_556794 [Mycena galopus ATCC 62051]